MNDVTTRGDEPEAYLTQEEYDARIDAGTRQDITQTRERLSGALQVLQLYDMARNIPAPAKSEAALKIILDACDQALLVLTEETS